LNSFEQPHQKIMPRVKHMLTLGALLAFVAYFGVWGGYRITEQAFGPVWAAVAAVFAGLGLIVIAIVGVIIIRTMRIMEERPAKEEGGEGPPA
jgi:hypothetical protein